MLIRITVRFSVCKVYFNFIIIIIVSLFQEAETLSGKGFSYPSIPLITAISSTLPSTLFKKPRFFEWMFNNIWVAPEGKWVPGGGIEILCAYNIYGPKIWKKSVRYFMLLILSSQLPDSYGPWAYLLGRAYLWSPFYVSRKMEIQAGGRRLIRRKTLYVHEKGVLYGFLLLLFWSKISHLQK